VDPHSLETSHPTTILAPAGRSDINARGGPRTPAGRAISGGNALKHGLSAETLLPRLLAPGLIDACAAQLRDEWFPQTATQELYVRDIARHQAALARAEAIEEAVLREGARTLLALGTGLGDNELLEDSLLSAAGTSEGLEKISRYRRQHERALGRCLVTLRELQAMAGSAVPTSPRSAPVFSTEPECVAYLVGWMKRSAICCPKCGHESVSWLASRHIWQCDRCRRQTSLRTATVMERSHASLLSWFGAIQTVVTKPNASMAAFAAATKIDRLGTVRKMVRKIREALASPEATVRLAGLDVYFAAR
jgi:transposase-like protein